MEGCGRGLDEGTGAAEEGEIRGRAGVESGEEGGDLGGIETARGHGDVLLLAGEDVEEGEAVEVFVLEGLELVAEQDAGGGAAAV